MQISDDPAVAKNADVAGPLQERPRDTTRRWWHTAAVGLFAALGSWPALPLLAQPGLDPSYFAALHVEIVDGLRHGHDLVFTFGPLGFLTGSHVYHPLTSALATLAQGVVSVVLVTCLAALVLRWVPPKPHGLAMAAVLSCLMARTGPGLLHSAGLPTEVLLLVIVVLVPRALQLGWSPEVADLRDYKTLSVSHVGRTGEVTIASSHVPYRCLGP